MILKFTINNNIHPPNQSPHRTDLVPVHPRDDIAVRAKLNEIVCNGNGAIIITTLRKIKDHPSNGMNSGRNGMPLGRILDLKLELNTSHGGNVRRNPMVPKDGKEPQMTLNKRCDACYSIPKRRPIIPFFEDIKQHA